MKTTKLSKQQIAAIKKSISAIVPKSTVLPVLECAYINNGDLHLSDLTTHVTIKNVGIEGQFLLDVKQLMNVLEMMPEFTTDAKDTSVKFESPDNSERFTFITDDYLNYPKTPSLGTVNDTLTIGEADLNRIFTAVKFISKDELRPAMMHVVLSDGQIVGTDAHMLYFENSDIKTAKELLLNSNVIKVLDIFKNDGDYTLNIGDKYYQLENNTVTIVSRIVDEVYPNYRAVIPDKFNTFLKVDTKQLSAAIDKADKMANKTTHAVLFEIDSAENKFAISSEDIDFGTQYAKDLSVCADINGKSLEIAFNATFIQKLIKLTDTKQLQFNLVEDNRACIVNNNILVMPVNKKKYA